MEAPHNGIKGTVLETAYNLGAYANGSKKELIGYSVIRKTQCEIYNYISPTLRIIRFIEGCAEWRIDNHISLFRAGDIIILNNLVKRNIHKVLGSHIMYEMFDFYPTVLSDSQLWTVFFGEKHLAATPDLPDYERIIQLLEHLRDEITGDDQPYKSQCIRNLLNLLAIQFSRTLAIGGIADRTIFMLSKSIQYIMEHLSENLTVSQIADFCSYTPEYFTRQFRRYIGITPVQYIINSRIEMAIHLIRTNQTTIVDAALLTGFRTSSAFYRSFRTYRGMTPSQYLNQLSKKDE